MKRDPIIGLSKSGQTTFIIILLLIFLIGSIGAAVFFYAGREQTLKMHLNKVDLLNKKIIRLSEYVKKRDIENKELHLTINKYKTELKELKQKKLEKQNVLQELSSIKSTLDNEFTNVNESLSLSLDKIDTFSRFFDAKIEDYLAKNKKAINQLIKEKTSERSGQTSGVELEEVVVTPEQDSYRGRNGEKSAKNIENKTVKYGQVNKTESAEEDKRIQQLKKKAREKVKVMKVNQKHNFIVINKGMIDGVNVGTSIAAYRRDIKIGNAIITEVRELVSLAKIENQYDQHFIEEGDTVIFGEK